MGRSHAALMSERGADIIVHDIKEDGANETAEMVRANGQKASVLIADVRDVPDFTSKINQAEDEHGKIDILVNNAGTAQSQPKEDMSLEVWDRIVQINQTQVFLCSREVGKHMLKKKRGAIINLASIMGLVGGGLYPNFSYHATKGAVVNMTRALAAECPPHGVRVNAIAPTFVKTNLTQPLRSDETLSQLVIERTPMGRFAEPEVLAGAFLFLASAASSMVTGHILTVDGGWTAV